MGCAKYKLNNLEPPTAEELFDVYQQKTSPVQLEWKNMHYEGVMEMPLMNVSMPIETWAIKNGGILTTYDMPNVGQGGQGYDMKYAGHWTRLKGTDCWKELKRTVLFMSMNVFS